MKNILCFLVLIPLVIFSGCDDSDSDHHHENHAKNKVLMLKIDYNTFTLEGYKEFQFDLQTDSFTIVREYQEPSDFGYIRFIYKELNQQLFYGTMWWDGLGNVIYPTALDPIDDFESVTTNDVVFPLNGFTNLFSYNISSMPFFNIWLNIQHLVIVRQYLDSNPNQKVYMFLYTPSVGFGDPLEWDYYIFLKN